MKQKPTPVEVDLGQPGRVNPRITDWMDARTLNGLLPRLHPGDDRQIRTLFRQYLTAPRTPDATSWQDAWNTWTGATANRPGAIEYTPDRCHICEGRRVTHRNIGHNLARTGSPHTCGACTGTGRGQHTRIVARFAKPEETPA